MSESSTAPPPVPSAAEFDMRRRRTSAPPWTDLPWMPADGTTRVTPLQLIEMLPAPTRAAMHAAMGNRAFCCCEIGVAAPNAETEPFDDGSVCVRINSGLTDFVYCATRTLFRGTTWTDASGEHRPALEPDGVGLELAGIYEQWRKGGLWRNERLRVGILDLPDGTGELAGRLARTAMLFFVCHEIGHAVLHAGADPDERTPAQEHEADAYGMDLAILGYARGARDERMGIAGALVAIRALTALSVLGHRFPGRHPPPRERLARLRGTVRRMTGNDEFYFHHTTIAYAMEEQMSAAELRILGLPGTTTLSAERIVSRLYATLEECVNGRLSREALRAIFLRDVAEAAPSVRARAGAMACRALGPAAPSLRFDPSTVRGGRFREMLALFAELRAALPVDLRQPFETTMERTPGDARS